MACQPGAPAAPLPFTAPHMVLQRRVPGGLLAPRHPGLCPATRPLSPPVSPQLSPFHPLSPSFGSPPSSSLDCPLTSHVNPDLSCFLVFHYLTIFSFALYIIDVPFFLPCPHASPISPGSGLFWSLVKLIWGFMAPIRNMNYLLFVPAGNFFFSFQNP